MHEHALINDLMKKLEEIATREGAVRVSRVRIRLGALSHISAEHFREHFEEASRGTRAETATLEVEADEDVTAPGAQEILLDGLDLELPDEA